MKSISNVYFPFGFLIVTTICANSIDYLALGDGTSTPLVTDTSLGNELYRTTVDSSSVDSSTGEITLTIDISGSEAVFEIKEAGLFDAASGGIMTNRVLVTYDHTTGSDIRIIYIISKA